MKKVLLLGATGMLGHAVYGALKDKYELIVAVRTKNKIALLENKFGPVRHCVIEFDAQRMLAEPPYYEQFLREAAEVDYVINAIGITQPFAEQNPSLTLFVNGDLPNILSKTFGPKLIHIATDGVYDGKNGPYDERAPQSPVGIYAESKSRGEPTGSLILRTSVIGRELEGHTGLVEWFLRQRGKTLKGYAEQYWNGITAKEFGRVCDRIMSAPEKYPQSGMYHIFSNTVSKYDMLLAFKKHFNVDCTIVPDHERKLNRTLSTIYDLNAKLEIPPFPEMVEKI